MPDDVADGAVELPPDVRFQSTPGDRAVVPHDIGESGASHPRLARAFRSRAILPLSDASLVMLGVLVLYAGEVASILALNGGQFFFSLDDAYIHLAVSEQIHALGYGLNPGEASTPSSSLLWPFVLSVTAGTPLHVATPLVLALLASLATAWLLLGLLRRAVGPSPRWLSVLIILTVMICLNWIGVAFTGMEHAAHVAAALAVGVGLVECANHRPPPWWLYAGIVFNPLLRYEGLAVAGAAVFVLVWYGHRRPAILCTIAFALPLAAFSVIAVRNGLDPLPSSVLVKSDVVNGGGTGMIRTVVESLRVAARTPVFALLVVGALVHLLVQGRKGVTPLHGYVLAVLGAHAIAGQFGWFGRYELYAYAAVLPVAVHFAQKAIAASWRHQDAPRRLVATTVVLVAMTVGYIEVAATTPLAARNIYLQQAQMARFADEHWSEPIAVNDVGLVAYRDGDYVLDLWGLASQDARKARALDNGPDWMHRLAVERGVKAAIIYTDPDWFPDVPSEWEKVARMSFTMPRITAAVPEVTFFATSREDADRLRAALRQFESTLPAGAALTME